MHEEQDRVQQKMVQSERLVKRTRSRDVPHPDNDVAIEVWM